MVSPKTPTMRAPGSPAHAVPSPPPTANARPARTVCMSQSSRKRNEGARRLSLPPPEKLTHVLFLPLIVQLALLTRVGELGRAVDVALACLWSTWTAVRELEVREEGGKGG